MKKYFIVSGALLVVFGALSGTVAAQSEPPPQLFIVSPAPGEVIAGNAVKVIIQLPRGIALVDPATDAVNAEGEGHLHIWLDALPAHDSAVSVVLSRIPEHTFANVFSGLHTLHAALFNNDHSPYGSRLTAGVEFETVGEELKPVPNREGQSEAPPEADGGLFIPRGKSNTFLVITLVIIATAILWYMFGRPKSKT